MAGKRIATQKAKLSPDAATLGPRVARLARFHDQLVSAGLDNSYEARHARLAVEYLAVTQRRANLLTSGKLKPLPPRSQKAADQSYLDTTARLCVGLEAVLKAYDESNDQQRQRIYRLWKPES